MNIEEYWSNPPPEPSKNLLKWIEKINNGWRPNKRISSMGSEEKAEFFKVYIWECCNVLIPLLTSLENPESR